MEKFNCDTFCERAKSLFGDRGQIELSEAIGISQGMISGIKQKKLKSPGADIICRIAQHFNVSTDWLLGISDIKQLTNDAKELYRQLALAFMVIQDLENAVKDYNNRVRFIAQEFEKKF